MGNDARPGADDIVRRLLAAFEEAYGSREDVSVVRAPGRVNLIGDHTDYNEGFVLPITIDRDVYAALRPRTDKTVAVRSLNFNEKLRYPLEDRPDVTEGSWTSYVTGAIEELRHRGHVTRGVEVVLYGDVPVGAGLSSSAALEVAVVYGLDTAFGLNLDPIDAIRLCQSVEHRYAGVECGIMDQFVSRLGRSGHVLLLDCRSLDHEHVPFFPGEADLALLIADTGITRELADSKYGERRFECRQAVSVVRDVHPEVESLRDVTHHMLEKQSEALGPVLYRRAKHVVEENARVLAARDAILERRYERVGRLMNASHAGLRDLFAVSCTELDTLVSAAQESDAVLGARMTGGGFGGCTVNLVRRSAVDEVGRALASAYAKQHGREPTLYVVEHNHQTETLR